MNYARARLWVGVTGVGTIVIVALTFLVTGAPQRIFPSDEIWRSTDIGSLALFFASFALLMLPFDLLGGWIIPNHFGRQRLPFWPAVSQNARATVVQILLYLLISVAILAAGRTAGIVGALAVVLVSGCCILALQGHIARMLTKRLGGLEGTLPKNAIFQLAEWQFPRSQTVLVNHTDPGFTGGVIGWPGNETVVIPNSWLRFSQLELAAIVARRVEAIRSGSRWLGIFVAFLWILSGFFLSSLLPGAGVRSVAGIVMTYSGFTLWSFLGLLLLPTLSRLSALAIDRRVIERGVDAEALESSLASLDRLQDDEPRRSPLVELIFHPVPSLYNRRRTASAPTIGAWHAARMTLLLSWACAGLLSRAVHCNVGRPELWIMLPTD